MSQQTILRVKTNVPVQTTSGSTTLSVNSISGIANYGGSGTLTSPITGTSVNDSFGIIFNNSGGAGEFFYSLNLPEFTGSSQTFLSREIIIAVLHPSGVYSYITDGVYREYDTNISGQSFQVLDGDTIIINGRVSNRSGSTISCYVVPNQVQEQTGIETYDYLDLYDDIPIKLNKSFSEIQDISKRNSDYSIGVNLPGSKKNNKFFENFYNVEADSLFFDVTKRVPVDILIDNEVYFKGFLKLNKVSVINSKVEYDVTLFSIIADLFGKIGNNLLRDLDYDDIDYHFNHHLSMFNVLSKWSQTPLLSVAEIPTLTFYPVVHNGYEYSNDLVNVSGSSVNDQTRLYTTTVPTGYTNYSNFTSQGGKEYRINSPKFPLLDNQLKPALSVWGLIQLLFKTYGYTIKSDFFNTPWFKLLYTYGIYSSDKTKLSYKITEIEQLPLEGVDIVLGPTTYPTSSTSRVNIFVTKKGTGIPAYCTSPITFTVDFNFLSFILPATGTIPALSTGTTINANRVGTFTNLRSQQVTIGNRLKYPPTPVGGSVAYLDGDYIDFSRLIDDQYKQIDFLSSIAKKFNLLFIPDPENSNQIIIEPYDYYIGTGQIVDWTDKLSFDKGYSVQPALNFVESEILFTDLDDTDEGNKQFKSRNNRTYGQNKVTNETDFKSQTKKVDTIFSPQLIRKWDNNVGLPLGINYVEQSQTQTSGDTEKVIWTYKGIKSKPKLLYYTGNFSPFIDEKGESYTTSNINTNYFRLQKSNGTNPLNATGATGTLLAPVISHTMPLGNPDKNKNGRGFNNDSISILFNSEEPVDIGLGTPTFNVYSDNDIYDLFYSNRIANLYNPNTRFLEGYFDLKLSDLKNYKYNDIIKINQQYFYLNKIDNFNVTKPELTKVELVQTNLTPRTYPTRYFKYQYCGDSRVYKFRTFFNPLDNINGQLYGNEINNSIRRTYYYWSLLYDYMVGVLGGNVSGYTSSYQNSFDNTIYAYTINEINEQEYNNSDYLFWYQDSNKFYFIDRSSGPPELTFTGWQDIYRFSNQSGFVGDFSFLNVGTDCTEFSGFCTTNKVVLSNPPGFTPLITYKSGITLNVTDTGWIKYTTKTGVVTYKQITSLGTYTITDCIDPNSIAVGIPFADLASYTITGAGSNC
jgi:hypothetical protein